MARPINTSGCSVGGCDRPYYGKGLCNMHWQRVKRHGTTDHQGTQGRPGTPASWLPSAEERFTAKVVKTDSCWEWQGQPGRNGYGSLSVNGRRRYAHRFSYELHVGPIPPERHLHHECGNPLCVNPEHLRPITNAEHNLLHRNDLVIV